MREDVIATKGIRDFKTQPYSLSGNKMRKSQLMSKKVIHQPYSLSGNKMRKS